MADSARDANGAPLLTAVSSADGSTPARIYADVTTGAVFTNTIASGSSSTLNNVYRYMGAKFSI